MTGERPYRFAIRPRCGRERTTAKPDWNHGSATFELRKDAQRAIDEKLAKPASERERVSTVGGYLPHWLTTRPRSERTDHTNQRRITRVLKLKWSWRASVAWRRWIALDRIEGDGNKGVRNPLLMGLFPKPKVAGSRPVVRFTDRTPESAVGVRSPVGGRARTRLRGEDVGDGSAAEGGGAHGLDGQRRGEAPLAGAQDDRCSRRRVRRSRRASGFGWRDFGQLNPGQCRRGDGWLVGDGCPSSGEQRNHAAAAGHPDRDRVIDEYRSD